MTLLLLALGALPLVFGIMQNWYMTTYMDAQPPYKLIALSVLLLWAFIAFLFNKKGGRTKKILICVNFVAAVDLLLLGIQELLLHGYWMNTVGAWSQLFFLPLMNFSFTLTFWSHRVFPAYAMSFVLLLAAALAGCKLREKITK